MTVRIVHLSDIHFGAEDAAALAGAADIVRADPFDLLAVSGDITQYGSKFEFEAARRWFHGLPGPMLFTPGNHDTPWFGLAQRLTVPFGRYAKAFGAPAAAGFEAGGLVAQAFNTARGAQVRLNWSKGAVRAAQARRAAEALRRAPAGTLRVAVCHHPLMELVGGPMTGRVRGGRRAAEILSGQADLILSGHVHAPFAMPLPFADGRTYAVGASTLSLRERGWRPGFNLIEADAASITVKALAWTGSRFEPERTWALERRGGAQEEGAPPVGDAP